MGGGGVALYRGDGASALLAYRVVLEVNVIAPSHQQERLRANCLPLCVCMCVLCWSRGIVAGENGGNSANTVGMCWS